MFLCSTVVVRNKVEFCHFFKNECNLLKFHDFLYFYASGAALIFRHLEYNQTIWKRNSFYRKIFIFTDYYFFLSVSINIFNGIESMIFIISLPWYRASTYFMYNLNLCSIDSMYSSKAVIMWFSNIHSLIHSICKISRYSYENFSP